MVTIKKHVSASHVSWSPTSIYDPELKRWSMSGWPYHSGHKCLSTLEGAGGGLKHQGQRQLMPSTQGQDFVWQAYLDGDTLMKLQ